MTIYEELIERVSNGETFHIDFEKQIMKIGKAKIIDNGQYDVERKLFKDVRLNTFGVLNTIELLYHDYKYSLPSERSDSKRKKYFKALPIEEIPDEQLMVTERREIARAKLEGFILCMILNGQFVWDQYPTKGKWFWQSENDPDLVILKNWIKNN